MTTKHSSRCAAHIAWYVAWGAARGTHPSAGSTGSGKAQCTARPDSGDATCNAEEVWRLQAAEFDAQRTGAGPPAVQCAVEFVRMGRRRPEFVRSTQHSTQHSTHHSACVSEDRGEDRES